MGRLGQEQRNAIGQVPEADSPVRLVHAFLLNAKTQRRKEINKDDLLK